MWLGTAGASAIAAPCPGTNAFQMGSAWLPVLGPAASPGWRGGATGQPFGHDVPLLGDPLGPGLGLGACWGDRYQPVHLPISSRGVTSRMGKGLCRGHQRLRAQPGWTQGQVGCSNPTAAPGFAHRVSPGWDARADRALGMQHCGDAGLEVPRHHTCSPRTASPVWPVAPGQRHGPVRPGCTQRQLAHDPCRGAKV